MEEGRPTGAQGERCRFDYVEVWEQVVKQKRKREKGAILTVDFLMQDDSSGANRTLGHFCGRDLPGLLSSDQRRVHVRFVSDQSVAPNGFRLEWVVNGCGGDLRGKSSGEIATPNYPVIDA